MKSNEYLTLLTTTLNQLDLNSIKRMVGIFADALDEEKQIFIMGNGGSGATASHAAGDFLKGASFGLKKRFKMICLNDNMPSLMAYANDVGWEHIFIEPLKNYLKAGDIVIGISGSGNSINVLNAIEFAKSNGAITIGMTGFTGGKLKSMVDLNIHSSAMDMEVAEDVHMAVFNMVKKECMSLFMGENPSMGTTYDNRVK
jgi:D-sedoheptulose 7-phosphate isomerase